MKGFTGGRKETARGICAAIVCVMNNAGAHRADVRIENQLLTQISQCDRDDHVYSLCSTVISLERVTGAHCRNLMRKSRFHSKLLFITVVKLTVWSVFGGLPVQS